MNTIYKSVEDVEAKIADFINLNYIIDKDFKLPLETSLLKEGIVDSFAFISIISFLEMEFHVVIPDQDIVFEKMGSVKKMAQYILEKI